VYFSLPKCIVVEDLHNLFLTEWFEAPQNRCQKVVKRGFAFLHGGLTFKFAKNSTSL